MSTTPPTPLGMQILLDHKIDPFVCSVLGATLGHLMDKGLHDDEILEVVRCISNGIRHAVKNPNMLKSMDQQADIFKQSLESDGE